MREGMKKTRARRTGGDRLGRDRGTKAWFRRCGRQTLAALAGLVITAGVWGGIGTGASAAAVRTATAEAQTLHAVRVVKLAGAAATLRLPLGNGSFATLHWRKTGAGLHSLAVTGGGLTRAVDWSDADFGTAIELTAAVPGRGSAPVWVLVTSAGGSDCGTGGCPVQSAAYRATSHRFEPVSVPGAFGPQGAYFFRLPAGKHRFVAQGYLPTTGFFGFVTVLASGRLELTTPLYDALGHVQVQGFQYVAPSSDGPGTSGGSWQLAGPPGYAPDRAWPRKRAIAAPTALAGFLTDASLGLYVQALSLGTGPKGAGKRAYERVRQVLGVGNVPALADVRSSERGGQTILHAVVYETAGGHASVARLVEASVTARLTRVGPHAVRVASLSLAPEPVRVTTVTQALRVLTTSPAVMRRLKGEAWLATAAVSAPGTWQIVLTRSTGSASHIAYVNADTRAVHFGV